MLFLLINLLKILVIIVPLLISVAYFTLAERKILGAIQRRRGPNVVGVFGLLQPLSDGFKLLMKETILPSSANKLIFVLSPMITFIISLMGWAVIPYDKYSVLAEINAGILYLFGVSSLGVYGIIMSGWSSNSKYAFLGALRSTAQMVSWLGSLSHASEWVAGQNLADPNTWNSSALQTLKQLHDNLLTHYNCTEWAAHLADAAHAADAPAQGRDE
jgi:NADH:ubiquinone oxidoreductase subunit H